MRHLRKSPGKARQEQQCVADREWHETSYKSTWRGAVRLRALSSRVKERRKLLATDIAWVGFSVHANSFTAEAETMNTFLTPEILAVFLYS